MTNLDQFIEDFGDVEFTQTIKPIRTSEMPWQLHEIEKAIMDLLFKAGKPPESMEYETHHLLTNILNDRGIEKLLWAVNNEFGTDIEKDTIDGKPRPQGISMFHIAKEVKREQIKRWHEND